MKTGTNNKKGFILFLAVAMIPLIGVALLLLSGGTRILADQERLARTDVSVCNLFASATAWADLNRGRIAAMQVGEVQPLDLTEFGLELAACNISLDAVTEGAIHLTIELRLDDHRRPRRRQLTLQVEGLPARPAVIPAAPAEPNDAAVPTPPAAQEPNNLEPTPYPQDPADPDQS